MTRLQARPNPRSQGVVQQTRDLVVVLAGDGVEVRVDALVIRLGVRAARMEVAAGRSVDEARRSAGDRDQFLIAAVVEPRDRLQQTPCIGVLGLREDLLASTACSTMLPAYMTATRSAISAMTARS